MPHTATKATPASLMFKHEVCDKLPKSPALKAEVRDQTVCKNDKNYKRKAKQNFDQRFNTKDYQIRPNDSVLIKDTSKYRNKFSPFWHRNPWNVVQTTGNALFLEQNGKNIVKLIK